MWGASAGRLLGAGLEMAAFFFQAEDGIRDADVTGVQTCALPISCLCAMGYEYSVMVCWSHAAWRKVWCEDGGGVFCAAIIRVVNNWDFAADGPSIAGFCIWR